jgi:hypothetical protein
MEPPAENTCPNQPRRGRLQHHRHPARPGKAVDVTGRRDLTAGDETDLTAGDETDLTVSDEGTTS